MPIFHTLFFDMVGLLISVNFPLSPIRKKERRKREKERTNKTICQISKRIISRNYGIINNGKLIISKSFLARSMKEDIFVAHRLSL